MPQGLITSLLLKLTLDYWYFTLIALLIKFFLIRYTVTNSMIKVFLIWFTGTIAFYCMACLIGIVFTSVGFYYIPFLMYIFAGLTELVFSSIVFKIEFKRLLPAVTIGDGIFFFLLFFQMT